MATKKLTNPVPKGNALISLAMTLSPFAIELIRKAADNPEVWKKVQEQILRLGQHRGDTPEDMRQTIEALREQIVYLTESADDDAEAKQAATWGKQLEQLDRAAALLTAPGATRTQKKTLKKKIGTLRAEILKAFIAEVDEDAQVEGLKG
ncbi:MAG: hypothetical protein ACTMII_09695 [Brachybacterium sp.]|uniref:hypothetical protein n=1 Tax=Brachybacterium tyrofermentans TaxID=47848 RepID=UPI000A1B6549|nr:hypothetical protein FM103_08400 [Corynebacterium xerosis]